LDKDDILKRAVNHPWLLDEGIPQEAIQRAMEMKDNPVCPKCERIALRDIGWSTERRARCPHCGWNGKADTLFETYIKQGMWR